MPPEPSCGPERELMGFLVSPAEPAAIRALGTTCGVPERHGFDVLWMERAVGGLVGVQRKTFEDLVASMADGRLAKELAQLGGSPTVKVAFLIVEGKPHWSPDGTLVHRFARWTRAQYRGLLRSVQRRGVIVELSDSLGDTVALVEDIARWCAKADHTSLDRRPKPGPDRWGQVTERGWASHLLQSLPTIGPKQAEAIFDHFDGVIPIGLTVSREDLLAVKGLGPKRADVIVRAFPPAPVPERLQT